MRRKKPFSYRASAQWASSSFAIWFHLRTSFCYLATDGEYVVNVEYRYRVVCITDVRNDCVAVVKHCSKTGKWHVCVLQGSQIQHLFFQCCSRQWEVALVPFNGGQICFLDGAMFRPSTDMGWIIHSYCLGVYRGFLRIMKLVNKSNGSWFRADTLSIWELEDYKTGKWNLEHKIPFNAFVSENSWVTKFIKCRGFDGQAVAFHPTNNNIVYLGVEGRIISCDLQRKELLVDGKTSDRSRFYGCENVF